MRECSAWILVRSKNERMFSLDPSESGGSEATVVVYMRYEDMGEYCRKWG